MQTKTNQFKKGGKCHMMKFTKNEIYSTVIALVSGTETPTFEKKDGDTTVMVTVPSEAIIDRMNKDIELASK